MENTFAIQDEVALRDRAELQTELAAGMHARGPRHPTQNLAAHNLYVQGHYHLNQGTEEGLCKAVEVFEKSIAEDAQYAQAYSGLADAYGLLGNYGVLVPADIWDEDHFQFFQGGTARWKFSRSPQFTGACQSYP